MERSLDILIATARIYFRTTADGGRQGPVKTGYRPKHVFEPHVGVSPLQTYIGEIRFSDIPLIYPGETHVVTIAFLRLPIVEKYIIPGRKWWIYEVGRLVAEGEIITLQEQ